MKIPDQAPRLFGAKDLGDIRSIRIPGKRAEERWIFVGRGRFANVFWNNDGEVLIYVAHGDLSKDIISQVTEVNKHIPPMKFLGYHYKPSRHDPKVKLSVYRSKFYRALNSKTAAPYTDTITALQMAHAKARKKFPGNIVAEGQCEDFNRYFINSIGITLGKLNEALVLLALSASDWGDHYIFDTPRPENFAIDDNGTLILLDPMFDAEIMQKHAEAK